MAGIRVALIALVVVSSADPARAQYSFTGLLTGQIGVSATNDVRDATRTPGLSLAVIDDQGLGAELDISHANDFDDTLFADSSLTAVMLNFTAVYLHPIVRPYFVGGAGVLRVRGAIFEGQPAIGRTEGAWNAGGGVHYMLNEMFAVRGDVRYFRHFQRYGDLPLGGDGTFDFWRTSAGLTVTWVIR